MQKVMSLILAMLALAMICSADRQYDLMFQRLDRNHDLHLDTAEIMGLDNMTNVNASANLTWRPHSSTLFVIADTDVDYKLTIDEFQTWFSGNEALVRRVARDHLKADSDVDGVVTRSEYAASPLYRRMKRTKDTEWANRVFEMIARGKEAFSKADLWWYFGSDDFGSADTDGNGYLSLQEFLASPEHLHDTAHSEPDVKELTTEFVSLDFNKDQHMSLLEYNDDLQKKHIEAEGSEWADEEEEIDEDVKTEMADVFAAMKPIGDRPVTPPGDSMNQRGSGTPASKATRDEV